jgi:NitT/TauT family transport system ATP-binding protein
MRDKRTAAAGIRSVVEPGRAGEPGSISVSSAGRSYGRGAGSTVALADVDLEIPRGRFVSIIGPSGSGKSTLLRLIAGLESPDSGSVSVFGAAPDDACATKRIGLVPQTPALLPWLTARQNVRLTQRLNRRGATGAGRAELPDVGELLTRLGLGASLDRRPHELSGGMQQRVAIARAFGLNPDVLLMDEPFSALDEFTREALQFQLLELWQQMATTVVFVTHSVSEAVVLSDEVVVMTSGPGRIQAIVPIDIPRPRRAEALRSPEVHRYEDLVREHLQTVSAASPAEQGTAAAVPASGAVAS